LLFLTTNRLPTIDPAFGPRIHLSISYPDLDLKSRSIIWKNFAELSRKNGIVTIDDRDLEKPAAFPLNGRQIKNTYKTAHMLAQGRKESVTRNRLETALRVTRPGLLPLTDSGAHQAARSSFSFEAALRLVERMFGLRQDHDEGQES
jgi:SpoVK/Ycf46/Vps4 family AAA+-type ATPase